jgi:transposase-like protein
MMYVRFPLPLRIVEDLLHESGIDISHEPVRFYCAAMKVIGNAHKQETGRWINNRGENSRSGTGSGLLANYEKGPFRRRERTMQRFRSMRRLQKSASVRSSVHNHFNHCRQGIFTYPRGGAPPLLTRQFQTQSRRCS